MSEMNSVRGDRGSGFVSGKDDLRRRAEATVAAARYPERESPLPAEVRAMLHELQVHQVELQMQNEELRQAQEALDAARARYFDLYDLAPVGYLSLSGSGLIREANVRASALFGVSRKKLSQQPLSHFVAPEDQDIYYRYRKQLLEKEGPLTCELRLCRPDNSSFWSRLGGTVARDDEPGERSCRLTITDISERKQAEEAREKLQEQLTQAQKMELVGRLAGGVAHDFNNMLGVVIVNADLAKFEPDLPAPVRERLEEIIKAAQRAAHVTRQLLGFARRQMARPEILDLNDTVADMLSLLGRLIGENIQLRWMPGGGLWSVKIDPAQVDQILTNLIVNSRDAIRGVGKISIWTEKAVLDQAFCADHQGAGPGEYVVLGVMDNGAGMSAEVRAHIFEPFYTTKAQALGSGMGLATVYGIVKQNAGFIDVESSPGQGSTFRIYLPRCLDLPALTAAPCPEAEAAPARGTETLLLVEDEESFLDAGRQILSALGYKVLAAKSPRQALELAGTQAGAIDLLITDVVLPGMDGKELAQRLTAARPGLRCLFMSGYPSDAIAVRGQLEESICFLQKPFTVPELARKVREVLASKEPE